MAEFEKSLEYFNQVMKPLLWPRTKYGGGALQSTHLTSMDAFKEKMRLKLGTGKYEERWRRGKEIAKRVRGWFHTKEADELLEEKREGKKRKDEKEANKSFYSMRVMQFALVLNDENFEEFYEMDPLKICVLISKAIQEGKMI